MKNTLNREGLTFEEWVCAAGAARFELFGFELTVCPYTRSEVRYVLPEGSRCFNDRREAKRSGRSLYPARIRRAWKAGEDPSDHRASAPPRTVFR